MATTPSQRADLPERPPEAELIRDLREAAPRISMRQAAIKADLSPARWQQIENGYRYFRGEAYPERGPAATVARMVATVRGTPQQLRDAGRPDAAAELEAILLDTEMLPTEGQRATVRGLIDKDKP